MHSDECKAIGVLDQLLRIPASVLSSEAVLPKVNAAISHLEKSSRKESSAVDSLISKLKPNTHQIKLYFRSDFGTVVKVGEPSTDDPLLSIITAIHPSPNVFAAYGYGAEVLYEEADVWMKNTGQKLTDYAKRYSTGDTTVEAIRHSFYFGRKFAYLEQQAPGLGQIACQARWLFTRVPYDDLAKFWTAFQKESALMGLLCTVDFRQARNTFRARLGEKRHLFRQATTGDRSLTSQGQRLGTTNDNVITDSSSETREDHAVTRPIQRNAKQQPLSLLDANQPEHEESSVLSLSYNHRQRSGLLPNFSQRPGAMGLGFQLQTHVTVTDTAQSIQFAINGNIRGLKELFSQRRAFSTEKSFSRGFTLVRWALYGGMHNYRTVQFLLDQGAPVDEESYHHVWDYAYRQKCTSTELNELRCIALHPPGKYELVDWVAEQRFPHAHRLIFERRCDLLSKEIDTHPSTVFQKDAMGRTALDWATARGYEDCMEILIRRGSPIDTIDVAGRTPVLHAVDSHNKEALRILLEANASPDPEIPNEFRRSSPLIAASFGGLTEMVKLLIYHGARLDACNPEGQTALQRAANAECRAMLLSADPSSNGSVLKQFIGQRM